MKNQQTELKTIKLDAKILKGLRALTYYLIIPNRYVSE